MFEINYMSSEKRALNNIEDSDDLQEIARASSKDDALREILDSRDAELAMSDYGFDENGLMFEE